MLQITDREAFATKLTFLMTSLQSLHLAGVPHTEQSIEASTNKFLDQFEAPAPATEEKPKGRLIGYVIQRISTQRTMYFNGIALFVNQEEALRHLNWNVVSLEERKEYEIVPVRTDG